jgi:hypothetical protein
MTTARSNERQLIQELLEFRRNLPGNFVFDRLFPELAVNKRTGKYKTASGASHNSSLSYTDAIREAHGEFPEVALTIANTNIYDLKRLGVRAKVDMDDAADSAEDGFDERRGAAIRAEHAMRIICEQQAKTLYEAAVAATTVGASSRWDDDGIDPRDISLDVLDDFRVAAVGGLDPADVVAVIYPSVWRVACRQNFVLENHRIANPGAPQELSEADFARFLGVGQVIVPRAVANTAKSGQTASDAFIWSGDKVIFAYLPQRNQRLEVNAAAANFVKAGEGMQVLIEEDRMSMSEQVLVTKRHDPRIVDSGLIQIFDSVIG